MNYNDDELRNILGKGMNLEELLRLKADLDNSMRSAPPMTPSAPSMPATIVDKPFNVGSMPTDIGMLPSTPSSIAPDMNAQKLDFISKFGKGAGKVASSAGKYALPIAGAALDMATMEQLGEGSDQVLTPQNAMRAGNAKNELDNALDAMLMGNKNIMTPEPIEGANESIATEEDALTPAQQFISKYRKPASDVSTLDAQHAKENAMLEQMNDASRRNQLIAGLADAAAKVGSSIAGTKYGGEVGQSLDKVTKSLDESEKTKLSKSISDRKEKDSEKDKMMERRATQLGLAGVEELSDPNSAISQQAREMYTKLTGKELDASVSGYTLQKAGLPLGNLVQQSAAIDSKKELKAQEIETKLEQKMEKLSDDKKKFARDLRKELTTGEIGKAATSYHNSVRISEAMAEFNKNPTGYSDYATLMGGLKSLQGDESVVREAEIKLGMRAGSLFDKINNDISQLTTGKSLQPSQRKAIAKTIEALTAASKEQYMIRAQPIINQANFEKIPLDIIMPAELHQDAKAVAKENKNTAPHGNRVSQGGKSYTWDGNKYVEDKE